VATRKAAEAGNHRLRARLRPARANSHKFPLRNIIIASLLFFLHLTGRCTV